MQFTRQSVCPHCDGVNPLSPAAILVHCSYCDSAYTFKDDRASLVGTVAIPAKSGSPLRIGTAGTVQGHDFEIRGHLRYRSSTGFWDEWFGITGEGKVLWIAEDEREFSIYRHDELAGEELDYESVRPGQIVSLGGSAVMVEEKDTASLAGFEGEIPFDISIDRSFPYIAGISNDERITFEFGGSSIERYRGKTVTLADLGITAEPSEYDQPASDRMNHSMDSGEHGHITELNDSAAEKLECRSCGAPLSIKGKREETITAVCSYCGSTLDARTLDVLAKSNSYNPPSFALALGAFGTMSGHSVTVVGRIRMVEEDWHWDEYLLLTEEGEYRWLTDDDGKWSTYRRIRTVPAELPQDLSEGEKFTWQNQVYRVGEISHGRVEFIDGEFSYYTCKGLSNSGFDAVNGMRILSCEWTSSEVEWYSGETVGADRIKSIFGLNAIPKSSEPAAAKSGSWLSAAVGTLILSIAALIFLSARVTPITSFSIDESEYSDSLSDDGFAEREIKIPKKGNYEFKFESSLSDNWLFVTTEIQDSTKNTLLQFDTDLSYYSGYEGGESWSEGSNSKSYIFSFSKPGTYHLLFTGENEQSTPPVKVTISQNAFAMRYLIILIAICIIIIVLELNSRGIISFDD